MKNAASSKLKNQWLGIDTSIALGLIATVIFFLASGYMAWLNLNALDESNQRVVQTHVAIVALDELLSNVQDAETGQRGFLLTNNEDYLEPFSSAVQAIPLKLQNIAHLTGMNPGQQQRLALLKNNVDMKIAELQETIDLRRSEGLEAALKIVVSDRGKEEMDSIRAQIANMAEQESEVRRQRIAEMKSAQQTAFNSTMSSGLLGILLTLVIGFLIRRATVSRRQEEWLQSGELALAGEMMGDQPIQQLGESLLKFIVRHVGGVAGAAFAGNGRDFQRIALYGVPDPTTVPSRFSLHDGLLGQIAAEGRPMTFGDVPDGYLSFGSALGSGKPKNIVIFPGAIDGKVNAVIEIGFLNPVEKNVENFLRRASEAVAIAVQSATYRSELQNLLEETQRQSEELQTQSEELRVSNEELEEQGRALKESQIRLEQQQAELEQTNSQLEEQAQELEAQRDNLERVNAAVEVKARELARASQYKSDFLANMSHELRTPLNSSLILAKLLADNPAENLTPEQVKFAQTIQSSGNDLLNLINDILDLSKIEAGHVEIKPETVVIETVSKNLRRMFEPMSAAKKLDLVIEFAPDLPSTIVTDPFRLEQVLKNLVSNAVKFTDVGSVRMQVGLSGSNHVYFAVTDTGIGIAAEQQQTIFEAFHQADGTISRRYGGTGLGLSISRQLVLLLGGTIEVASEPGKGSTFTVTLPKTFEPASVGQFRTMPTVVEEKAKAVEANKPSPVHRRTLVAADLLEDDRASVNETKRVLLVIEDDASFAAIVRDLSREMGFYALVAGTAEEALRLAKEQRPNAIILDVGLPDHSGLAVLDRLKNDVDTRHIPIHMISAEDHSEAAFSLGAVGYAVKPVRHEQLIEVLEKLDLKLSQDKRRILIVEDDPIQRDALAKLLGSRGVETILAGTAAKCLELLRDDTFDCMVLDLSLPDASGYSLLETLSRETAYGFPPVIVYTGRELSPDDEQHLRRYSKSIIIKGAKSPERLLDEVALFLHQVISELPPEQQTMIRKARNRDAILEGRRILVVEDDVRNVYALNNILEPRGAIVEIARNGQEAIDALERAAVSAELRIDLVLMDVMMPVMDGLTATREIRKKHSAKSLPIVALTAKAMPDDQQRCLDAGANDYMAKPLDVDKLLSLVRVWMPR